ncbi:helix-turn-helix domain-containing protein [Ectopseudomonas guguanensis]|uniref:helix-turn-helix domain-containing protein n=1 Tax=Ectopseudomonas guguanensis TaxID=1198456 RepID=UPI00285B6B4C|nr:helix-turn-helix transcriptional regulator [Pseudomonas guguanensis]MDR8014086.1 helix-turn-helix transcriptional regulator [Pseudomonas guguanensis]
MNIGERLKEERVRLGYNQGDFAAIAGVAKTSQFNYEKGERSPDAAYLAAVAEKGVDVLYVVTGRRTPEAFSSFNGDEIDLVEHYRQLPEDERQHTHKMVNALAEMAGRYDVKK